MHSAIHAFLSCLADPDSKKVVRVEMMYNQCMGHNDGRDREVGKQSDG